MMRTCSNRQTSHIKILLLIILTDPLLVEEVCNFPLISPISFLSNNSLLRIWSIRASAISRNLSISSNLRWLWFRRHFTRLPNHISNKSTKFQSSKCYLSTLNSNHIFHSRPMADTSSCASFWVAGRATLQHQLTTTRFSLSSLLTIMPLTTHKCTKCNNQYTFLFNSLMAETSLINTHSH